MFPNLPTVELVLPPPQADCGLIAISLVDRPAIGVDFVLFSEGGQLRPKPLKLFFDAEQGIVTGPILIPNQPVLRAPTEEYPEGYACYMTVDTIKKAVQMFFAQGKTCAIDIMHDPMRRCSGFIFETWIKAHMEMDKSNIHFPGLPVGTAFISVQINDEPTLEAIRNGELAGFSMAGYFDMMKSAGIQQRSENPNDMAQQPPQKKNQAAAKAGKPTAKADAKGKNFLQRFMQLFEDMGMAAEEMAAETVTATDVDGNEVTLPLDANGGLAIKMSDGTPAMLALETPAAEAAEEGAAGEAEPGPGSTTEAVDNPMDVAALRAEFRGVKLTPENQLLLMMAERMASLEEQLNQLHDQPAGPPAKGPSQKNMRQSFARTEPPKKETLKDVVDERMAKLREERLAKKNGTA